MNGSRWACTITMHRPSRKLTEARLRRALNSTMAVAGGVHPRFPDLVPATDSPAERAIAEEFEFPVMKDGLAWSRPAPGVVEAVFVLDAAPEADITSVCSRAVSVLRTAIGEVPALNGHEAAQVRIDGVDVGRITRED